MQRKATAPDQVLNPLLADELCTPINTALLRAGRPPVRKAQVGLCFACDAADLHRHAHGNVRQLTDESILPAEGLSLPEHCFPGGLRWPSPNGDATQVAERR